MNLSDLYNLPWTADPDTYTHPEGITLSAYLAERASVCLATLEDDAWGDHYCEDCDAVWTAVMDGSVETAAECESMIQSLMHRGDSRTYRQES